MTFSAAFTIFSVFSSLTACSITCVSALLLQEVAPEDMTTRCDQSYSMVLPDSPSSALSLPEEKKDIAESVDEYCRRHFERRLIRVSRRPKKNDPAFRRLHLRISATIQLFLCLPDPSGQWELSLAFLPGTSEICSFYLQGCVFKKKNGHPGCNLCSSV